jgi:uncharacterized protein YbjT (DUF2867 family)
VIQVINAGSGPSVGGVVLVAGATGGVGKRVVQQLLAGGRCVRALVRDVAKARSLLVRCHEAAACAAEPGALILGH